jgi:integrase
MRTTLTLDDDLAGLLKQRARPHPNVISITPLRRAHDRGSPGRVRSELKWLRNLNRQHGDALVRGRQLLRRHLATPCRRATIETDAPGSSVSATIRRFNTSGHCRRVIKATMRRTGIAGPMACPKGLRHRFGIRAGDRSVPTNLIQRWMGHASPTTTVIYLDAVGLEERQFANRMW